MYQTYETIIKITSDLKLTLHGFLLHLDRRAILGLHDLHRAIAECETEGVDQAAKKQLFGHWEEDFR